MFVVLTNTGCQVSGLNKYQWSGLNWPAVSCRYVNQMSATAQVLPIMFVTCQLPKVNQYQPLSQRRLDTVM